MTQRRQHDESWPHVAGATCDLCDPRTSQLVTANVLLETFINSCFDINASDCDYQVSDRWQAGDGRVTSARDVYVRNSKTKQRLNL